MADGDKRAGLEAINNEAVDLVPYRSCSSLHFDLMGSIN